MKKKTTAMQWWDRFVGWGMFAAAILFTGNFVIEVVQKWL